MENEKRASTGRDSEKYIVRFPDGMRDRIAELAKANNRTMNAEIVARLQKTLADEIVTNTQGALLEEIYDLVHRKTSELADAQRQGFELMLDGFLEGMAEDGDPKHGESNDPIVDRGSRLRAGLRAARKRTEKLAPEPRSIKQVKGQPK